MMSVQYTTPMSLSMDALGYSKGCKSQNMLIYTLVCGERGKGTHLSYFVVLQSFSKFSQVVV